MNDEAVYRRAPATLGLLTTMIYKKKIIIIIKKKIRIFVGP